MEKRKDPIRYEPRPLERSFVLRLSDEYTKALDGLVKEGIAKSRNDLIIHIIGIFLSDLRRNAEAKKDG